MTGQDQIWTWVGFMDGLGRVEILAKKLGWVESESCLVWLG